MHVGRKMSAFAPDLGFDPAQVVLALLVEIVISIEIQQVDKTLTL